MKRTYYKTFLLTAATGILSIPHACSFIVRHGHGYGVAVHVHVGGQQQQQQQQPPCASAQSLLDTALDNNDDDWRNHPDLNIRLDFTTWIVPSQHVQTVMKETRVPLPLYLRKKIRLVRPFNETHQLVLRQQQQQQQQQNHDCHKDPNALLLLLKRHAIQLQEGPPLSIPLDPSYFTAHYILQTVLPASSLPPPTSYEQVGHVVHLNLREHHWPFRHMIGNVFLETLPGVETVVTKVGNVDGPHRTYPLEVLAGRNDTDVTVVEDDVSLCFNLRNVYWCGRLAGERQHLLWRQFGRGQTVVDVFSGVGALCLLAAKKRHCIVHANDWNPHAISSLNEAAGRNHVHIHTTCGDAYEYLVDVGLHWGDVLPHHVVMNYPLEAPTFLSALRWWRVVPNHNRPKKKKKKKMSSLFQPFTCTPFVKMAVWKVPLTWWHTIYFRKAAVNQHPIEGTTLTN